MNAQLTRPPQLPSTSRYEFIKEIGAGGVGTVFKALDRRTGDHVAIKVLKQNLKDNPTLHQRLAREFKAACELEHPNIVRALAFETDGDLTYLVYELVEGGSLADRLEKHSRLPEDVSILIITQIAQALHYAHERQVIHRDVKPDNILLLPSGKAKLTDFGLAKDYGEDNVDLTRAATGLGTPNFMAPEQFADAKNVDARCDVYALGATLYNLVTGVIPFNAKTALAMLTMKETSRYKSVRALVPTINERTEAAIRAALEPDLNRRPASCLEFFKLLTGRRRLKSELLIKTPPPLSCVRMPVENRRKAIRFPLRIGSCGILDTSIHENAGWQEKWPLVVRDVSATGIGVVLARRFEVGTQLMVELAFEPNKPVQRLPIRVQRVQIERAGHWAHGCTFEEPLSDTQVHALVKYA